jgi:Holliday junction resolvase
MPTTRYERGRNLEYRLKKQLEDEGYTVIRSAGSHSPVDLVAFNQEEVLFIQVKSSESQAKRVEKIAVPSSCKFLICFPIKLKQKVKFICYGD